LEIQINFFKREPRLLGSFLYRYYNPSMNISKALKLKNKLVSKINQEYNKFSTYNSFNIEVEPAYDALEAFENWKKLTDELIELKTKIHQANLPVYDKIFRMAELKSMVSGFKRLNCSMGKSTGYNGVSVEFACKISIPQRDQIVSFWEEEIEKLQEELEQHNALTKI